MIPAASPGYRLKWLDRERAFEVCTDRVVSGVGDSWLVEDSLVRALDLHFARFSAACHAWRRVATPTIESFLEGVREVVPPTGRWFPRVEMSSTPEGEWFSILIRPAPSPQTAVSVWVSDGPDRRRYPSLKGPDLPFLESLRRTAESHHCQEALLLDDDGLVLEGVTTSIMWWKGDTLVLPARASQQLPSITRQLLLRGIVLSNGRVAFPDTPPNELSGLEVWMVNSLHGIRAVNSWTGQDLAVGEVVQFPRWERYLKSLLSDR